MSFALQVGAEVADTGAEGPGRRYAIWLQGCPLRCPGCCNPELLPTAGGERIDVETLLGRIVATPDIEGITLVGGEPFAQTDQAAALSEAVRQHELSVVTFSGYTLAELRTMPSATRLLAATDLLIDGRYERDKPDTTRRWVGSTNQRLHFLSERYSEREPQFAAANTIELRLTDNGRTLTINGHPW